MKQKKVVSAIALVLIVLMIMSLLLSAIPTRAYAVTQEDLNTIKIQKNTLSNQRATIQQKIDDLVAQQASALEQKAALDERNENTLQQIDLVMEEIEYYNGLIEQKSEELSMAQKTEDDQLERYRTRVRAMEESGGYNILALIANSESFSELLTAIDDMGVIMDSDQQLWDEYIEARESCEDVKEEYEATKAESEEKMAGLKEEQAELEAQIEDACELLVQLEDDIEKAKKEYEIALAAEEAAAAEMAAIAAKIAQEAAAAAAAAAAAQMTTPVNYGDGGTAAGAADGGAGQAAAAVGSTGATGSGATGTTNSSTVAAGQSSGSFVWPVPSSNLITSPYGWRVHPILGTERFHSGIDINGYGNAGGNILAADGGVVEVAQYSSSYGNYVMLNHGNGNLTLYAHMSGMAVSVGQTVTQGQVIGYLGDTGWATGVHCHFEIYLNGERIDPETIFSGYPHYDS